MLKKFIVILMLFLVGLFSTTKAQDSSSKKFDFDDDWEWEYDLWDPESKPFIELNYGFGEAKHKSFNGEFSRIGTAEIKLGYSSTDTYVKDYILELDDRYILGEFFSTDLRSKEENSGHSNIETWRFGFGQRNAYGYTFGEFGILPYSQSAVVWSKVDVKETPANITESDREILGRYDGTFRFGTLTEGGLKIQIVPLISLNASYEASVIFPRHLFWKHMGSFALESFGILSIEYFVDEIMDSTPAAGPIVNFLLKNGFAYAFYILKRDKMNWPFPSESPLTYETFKFGLTFTF